MGDLQIDLLNITQAKEGTEAEATSLKTKCEDTELCTLLTSHCTLHTAHFTLQYE